MMSDLDINGFLLNASIWALPVLLAITLHEAAHGWAAAKLGDPTARLMGRVTLNPFAHVDLVGTVLIPLALLLMSAPFLFGYAKPVPVNFSRLRNPRRDMALVALAGPASNILLAILGALAFHLVPVLPDTATQWAAEMLQRLVLLNLILAVFNMLPIPPLDGGRILVSILPDWAAWKVARLERAGLFIVIGVLFLLPYFARELGYDFNVTGVLIWAPVDFLMSVIATLTGH
ncbi:site-2 protease family protein [Thalassobaculum litoreum]|uniref:Zn-dependent protease (Includes SpoIVFB) n=1 Tax=Thalassobaculum litoreum DSM 18839 TaxID=1123362 RepID=A0A8G2BEK3_9PROT|nr:site-2 protease family protein [Thalassobaculum litoreum]SDF16732.1 Zn-dependent protease (includes SpoIVFB) [Thalassobaculum litoreum DSM 18839]